MADDQRPAEAPEPAPGQQLWGGLTFSAWLRLLARHRFRADRGYRAALLSNTAASLVASLLGLAQSLRYGRRVARTPLTEPPLFVLGFFRSGTTLLHDLLALDPRHTYPNTYECFMTNHFLLTEDFVKRRFPLQATRVMDNVPMTWDMPQEDEFALCMLGQPSYYLNVAFPNDPPQYLDYLDLEHVPPHARAAWKRALYRFLQAVTLKRPGRLVLKSPLHTARVKLLLEMFPEARFVHIVRDPYRVFTSTVKMLRAMYTGFGLQRPTFEGLEERVYNVYLRMMQKLEADRGLAPAGRFFEVRYEDLVRDPAGRLRALYDALGLGDFEVLRPRLEAYLAEQAGYKPNRYDLAPALRAEITRHWGDIIRRYGYAEGPASPTEGAGV